MIILALGLALVAGQPAITPPAAASSPSAEQADARRLALEAVRLSYPAELARRESVRASDAQFRQGFSANPRNAVLEKRFPGITDAMAAAASTEVTAALLEIEPQVLAAVAEDMAARMSVKDIRTTIEFYKSPAGQALLSLDPRLMDKQTGMVPLASLSVKHRQAIGQYQASEAGQRAVAATAHSLELIPETAARLFAPYRARVSAKVEAAANSFIAKRSK